ncbi:MAG: type II toxin-antitoxin system HicB family antitoxin [Ignavibacteria bacterium]
MKKYLVVFEKTKTGYSAFVPDLPGCAAAGKSKFKTEKLIKEAIEFHIEGLNLYGYRVPEPTDNYAFIKVKPPVRNTNKERITLKKKVN